MDKELLKLSKLCEHWANHNESHKENFIKWRDIAEKRGLDSVAEKLNKAVEMMDKCSEYLLAIHEELK
jgi:nickel/cobalt exporter